MDVVSRGRFSLPLCLLKNLLTPLFNDTKIVSLKKGWCMNFISRDTDYGIRALLCMADADRKKKKKIATVGEIVEKEDLPERFLRRVLQRLAKKGILRSYKGKDGGFSFRKLPDEITLTDIIEVLQGKIDLTNCVLKGKICPGIKKCVLRKKLKDIGRLLNKEFKGITIASLS